MKLIKLFTIILLFTAHFCFAQSRGSILVVPVRSDMVVFDNHVRRMLYYNKTPEDSVRENIRKLILSRLILKFPEYRFINIDTTKYGYLKDSLKTIKLVDTLAVNISGEKRGFKIPVLESSTNPQFFYYSRILSEESILIFEALMKNYKCKYMLLINAFQATTPMPFDRKTYLYLHIEIYDTNLRKIYGSKSMWCDRIRKKMFSIVFPYFAKNAIDDLYTRSNLLFASRKKQGL